MRTRTIDSSHHAFRAGKKMKSAQPGILLKNFKHILKCLFKSWLKISGLNFRVCSVYLKKNAPHKKCVYFLYNSKCIRL